jgi:hypothetical protein
MKTFNNFFRVSSYLALVGWIVLIGFPHWQLGRELVIGIIVALLSFIYSYLVFFGKRHDDPALKIRGSFWSLKGVMGLFKSPRAVLAGWIHYLAFDLMIGLYVLNDAAVNNISHWMLIPCLLLTLLFGPAGLLVYFLLRFALTQEFMLVNLF